MKELFELFYTFAFIGVTTFGGGAAMLPILQRELVDKRAWTNEEDLTDYYAIGQCTPGIIAVNTATFIGYKRKGIIGAITATLGIIFPSIVIITAIAAFLSGFADLEVVKNAFAGIRACVCVLILNAVIKLWKSAVTDTAGIIIFVCAFIVSAFTSLPVAIIVLVAGLAGFIIRKLNRRASK